MKKLILIIAIVCFVGCQSNNNDVKTVHYKTVEIEGCEYLYINSNQTITHKGNCKHCKERAEQNVK